MSRTASLVTVVALLAAACSAGSTESPRPATPAPGATSGSVVAEPEVPRVDGPVELTLRPAFTMVGGTTCEPSERLACGADGASYRVFGAERPVTLRAATTALNEGHTSWTTTLRLEADDAGRARAAAREAGASGGVLLVLMDAAVALVVAPDDVEGGVVRLEGLDKAPAWQAVEALGDA